MASTPSTPRRRSRPLRVERDDVLQFITCRTIEGRFWLHPLIASGLEPPNRKARRGLAAMQTHTDKRLTRMVKEANARKGPNQPTMDVDSIKRISRGLVGSALARAQERYGVEVFALVVMSNHIHLVVRTPNKNLAAFMGYFKARVTDAVNRITGKRGPMWVRRYDAQPIIDDVAVAGRVAYTLDNPVAAKLVGAVDEWPGLNLAFGMGESDELSFEFLNCTAWHKKRRPADLAPFFEQAALTLLPVPSCEGMDRELYKESVLGWLRQHEADRNGGGAGPMGVTKVIHSTFDYRPHNPKKSRRPYVFGSPKGCTENFAMMSRIHAEHRDCSDRFLGGDRGVQFPAGTYPLPILLAA